MTNNYFKVRHHTWKARGARWLTNWDHFVFFDDTYKPDIERAYSEIAAVKDAVGQNWTEVSCYKYPSVDGPWDGTIRRIGFKSDTFSDAVEGGTLTPRGRPKKEAA